MQIFENIIEGHAPKAIHVAAEYTDEGKLEALYVGSGGPHVAPAVWYNYMTTYPEREATPRVKLSTPSIGMTKLEAEVYSTPEDLEQLSEVIKAWLEVYDQREDWYRRQQAKREEDATF